jgi:hypothetical protein
MDPQPLEACKQKQGSEERQQSEIRIGDKPRVQKKGHDARGQKKEQNQAK